MDVQREIKIKIKNNTCMLNTSRFTVVCCPIRTIILSHCEVKCVFIKKIIHFKNDLLNGSKNTHRIISKDASETHCFT